MAAANKIVTETVEGVLEQIKKNAPLKFIKLNADPKLKESIIKAARDAATEQVTLAQEFASRPDQDIRNRLAKYLPEKRIKMIEEGLSIPTFRMEIHKEKDGKHWVKCTREGAEFLPAIQLSSGADVQETTFLQWASILVEAVLLVMNAVGIEISPSGEVIDATVEDVVEFIESSPKLQKAIEKFIESWNAAGGSAWSKAKAIFYLIKDSYSAGILWNIIKSLCQEMKWYDWMETAAKVTAMIIAALATDGAALIAEIALVVMSAVDFARKIANSGQLKEIKTTM